MLLGVNFNRFHHPTFLLTLGRSSICSGGLREFATGGRIKVENPVVDLDGDEMTRYSLIINHLIFDERQIYCFFVDLLFLFMFTQPCYSFLWTIYILEGSSGILLNKSLSSLMLMSSSSTTILASRAAMQPMTR